MTREAYNRLTFLTLTNKEFMLLSPPNPRLLEWALDLLLEGTKKKMKTSKANDKRRRRKRKREGVGERKSTLWGKEGALGPCTSYPLQNYSFPG